MILLTPKGYVFKVKSLDSYERNKIKNTAVVVMTEEDYEKREDELYVEPYGINDDRNVFFCDRGVGTSIDTDLVTFLLNFNQ